MRRYKEMKEKNAICICTFDNCLYLSQQKKDLCKEEVCTCAWFQEE